VPLGAVLATRLFDYAKASSSAGWLRALEGHHVPETEAYGIRSFVYRTPAPFDAEKLWALLNDSATWPGVLRSKGFFWVAADHRVAYEWNQAGGVSNVSAAGMWWAALPQDRRPSGAGERPDQKGGWHARYGDRCQQLVFIGIGLDEPALRARLDACLLDPSLASAANSGWQQLANPFPKLEQREQQHRMLLAASGDGERSAPRVA
jgi:G3E family GTPase